MISPGQPLHFLRWMIAAAPKAGNASIDLLLEGVSTEGKLNRHVKMCFGTCSNFQPDTLEEDFAGEKYQFILKAVKPALKSDVQVNKTDYAISLDIKKK
jgi:hypothetical protein